MEGLYGSWVGERTFAGTRGNGEVAPIPAVRRTAIEPQGSTHNSPSSRLTRSTEYALEPTYKPALSN
jgi:hypothetical protein